MKTKEIKPRRRNRWFTISTIFVTAVVFTVSSFFISLSIIGKRAITYYEQKAQVIIFFDKETPEEEITAVKEKLNNPELVESITYISQEEALSIYKEDFAEDPELLSTITADALPPSLEIRAVSIDALLTVIEDINAEKSTNVYIDDVMYYKDVIENIRTMSTIISIGTIVIISTLAVITFFLIRVTIGLNIKLHQDEIRIMHLVGGSEGFIKTPFLIEGSLYGIIGGFLASSLILVPWYVIVYYSQSSDFFYWINQLLNNFDLSFLTEFNLLFVLVYYLVHVTTGAILGFVSSYSAVHKYLGQDYE